MDIRKTFEKIKSDLTQWDTLKNYGVELDNIILTSQAYITDGLSGQTYIKKIDTEWDLTDLVLRAINAQIKEKTLYGSFDMLDESGGYFFISGKGLSTNEEDETDENSHSFYSDDKNTKFLADAYNQHKWNGFVILSKELQSVVMDNATSYEKLARLRSAVDYERFLDNFEIDKNDLYMEVDDLLSTIGYSPFDFASNEALWGECDKFLKDNDLSDKVALIAVKENDNDLKVNLSYAPKLADKNKWCGYITEIPQITAVEKEKIVNFLEDIVERYTDEFNGELNERLYSAYPQRENDEQNETIHRRKQ